MAKREGGQGYVWGVSYVGDAYMYVTYLVTYFHAKPRLWSGKGVCAYVHMCIFAHPFETMIINEIIYFTCTKREREEKRKREREQERNGEDEKIKIVFPVASTYI